MKITAFISSSGHNGNTATAAGELLRGAAEAGADTDICYLLDYQIKPCRGCRVCETTNACVIRDDDVAKIHEKILASDAYIIGTPTYYGDITGQYKQFVDRCYPFVDIKKDPLTKKMSFGSVIPVRKPGIMINVAGNHGAKVFESHLKVGYFCFNDLNAYPWKEILITNTSWKKVQEQPETMDRLYRAGKALAEHLLSGGKEDPARTKKFYDHFRLLEDIELPSYEENISNFLGYV